MSKKSRPYLFGKTFNLPKAFVNIATNRSLPITVIVDERMIVDGNHNVMNKESTNSSSTSIMTIQEELAKLRIENANLNGQLSVYQKFVSLKDPI